MRLFRKLSNARKRGRAAGATRKTTLTRVPDFSGVEVIVSPDACCEAAQGLASRRFLVDEMPILPLEDCDADYCRCSYQRFDDRRRQARRAADVGFDLATHLRDTLRRAALRPGRRTSDQV